MAKRANLLALGLLAFGINGVQWAAAQVYPSRTVGVIVPFAAGGTTDVIARIVGEHMSRTLGQQFIVENVGGAGGTTGWTRAMRASPDGYTLVLGNMGHMRLRWRSVRTSPTSRTSISRLIGMVAALPVVAKKDCHPQRPERIRNVCDS